MRTQQQYLSRYERSHRHPLNQWIHVFCVPVIFAATLGLLWSVPVGRWLGLAAAVAPYVNLATLLAPLALVFYASLSPASALAMVAWFAASAAAIVAIQLAGWPLAAICAGAWVLGWAAQFYGHGVEGARPSFAEDLVFLLIGPLFVMRKFGRRGGA